ncbi:hypothetical protein EDC01DRAFT_479936, partial [Geopyxis carbonaria]
MAGGAQMTPTSTATAIPPITFRAVLLITGCAAGCCFCVAAAAWAVADSETACGCGESGGAVWRCSVHAASARSRLPGRLAALGLWMFIFAEAEAARSAVAGRRRVEGRIVVVVCVFVVEVMVVVVVVGSSSSGLSAVIKMPSLLRACAFVYDSGHCVQLFHLFIDPVPRTHRGGRARVIIILPQTSRAPLRYCHTHACPPDRAGSGTTWTPDMDAVDAVDAACWVLVSLAIPAPTHRHARSLARRVAPDQRCVSQWCRCRRIRRDAL